MENDNDLASIESLSIKMHCYGHKGCGVSVSVKEASFDRQFRSMFAVCQGDAINNRNH